MVRGRFEWREGYGAFSYSKAHVHLVIDYIKAQEEHHKKSSFLEGYNKILHDFGIGYDEKYIFKPIV